MWKITRKTGRPEVLKVFLSRTQNRIRPQFSFTERFTYFNLSPTPSVECKVNYTVALYRYDKCVTNRSPVSKRCFTLKFQRFVVHLLHLLICFSRLKGVEQHLPLITVLTSNQVSGLVGNGLNHLPSSYCRCVKACQCSFLCCPSLSRYQTVCKVDAKFCN